MIDAILDCIAAAVFVHDEQGQVILMNEEAALLTGTDRNDVLGLEVFAESWQFFKPDGSALPIDDLPTMITLRTGETVRDFIMGANGPDGTTIWMKASSKALSTEEDGTPRRFTVVTLYAVDNPG